MSADSFSLLRQSVHVEVVPHSGGFAVVAWLNDQGHLLQESGTVLVYPSFPAAFDAIKDSLRLDARVTMVLDTF